MGRSLRQTVTWTWTNTATGEDLVGAFDPPGHEDVEAAQEIRAEFSDLVTEGETRFSALVPIVRRASGIICNRCSELTLAGEPITDPPDPKEALRASGLLLKDLNDTMALLEELCFPFAGKASLEALRGVRGPGARPEGNGGAQQGEGDNGHEIPPGVATVSAGGFGPVSMVGESVPDLREEAGA